MVMKIGSSSNVPNSPFDQSVLKDSVPCNQKVLEIVEKRNWDLNSIQDVFNEKIIVDRPENVQGAGMILLRRDSLDIDLEVLIIKEKLNDGTEGKFGFPKGKTSYQCEFCQIKNCEAHRRCAKCNLTEQLCRTHWKCQKCRNLKGLPFCPRHKNVKYAIEDDIIETKGQCALREVRQEIGIDYKIFPHVIVGWVKIGRNTFFLVFTESANLTPQEDEIEEYRWVNLMDLKVMSSRTPNQFNMGIRRLFKKHSEVVETWLPYCYQVYRKWFHIQKYLTDITNMKLVGDLSVFFWILLELEFPDYLISN